MLAFGTYKLDVKIALEMIHIAYKLGIRHFDTAQLYKNDIKVTDLVRSFPDTFLTTKIHRTLIKNCHKDNRAIANSIYGKPDLVLLHSPEKNYDIAWKQLTDTEFKCGVSNFTADQIYKLETEGHSLPYVNQIELSPYCQSCETVLYCERKGILIQGHSTLTKGELLDESVACSLSKKHGATTAQLLLSWGLMKNYTMCFTTRNIEHLVSDVSSVNIALSADDMQMLDSLDCGYRTHPQYIVT